MHTFEFVCTTTPLLALNRSESNLDALRLEWTEWNYSTITAKGRCFDCFVIVDRIQSIKSLGCLCRRGFYVDWRISHSAEMVGHNYNNRNQICYREQNEKGNNVEKDWLAATSALSASREDPLLRNQPDCPKEVRNCKQESHCVHWAFVLDNLPLEGFRWVNLLWNKNWTYNKANCNCHEQNRVQLIDDIFMYTVKESLRGLFSERSEENIYDSKRQCAEKKAV